MIESGERIIGQQQNNPITSKHFKLQIKTLIQKMWLEMQVNCKHALVRGRRDQQLGLLKR
jgi:hypothetical protein